MINLKTPGYQGKMLILLCALILSITTTYGQTKTVTGTIKDEDGMTLPGVTVAIKGTTNGTISDYDGNYSMTVKNSDILVFSYIGFETQEILVGNQTTINLDFKMDVGELSEVVVIGYGQIEEGDVTGVVDKISEKNFNRGMIVSPERLIAGKAAGVQITANSGEPGGGTAIRIRGGSSLGGGSDPLYVVDGVPLSREGAAGSRNPLSFINPSDIADITILKDASASAIYGVQAASGVIIITTKEGTSGKPQFSYDGSVSLSQIIGEIDMLSQPEFVFTVDRRAPRNLDDLGVEDQLSNTDWLDEVTRNAIGQNHNFGASFGIGKNTSIRASGNYQQLDGVLKTSSTERIAGSLNITQKLLNNDLTLKWNSKHSVINNRFAPSVVGGALSMAPTQPINTNDGSPFEWVNTNAPLNPVSQIDRTFNIGRSQRNLMSLQARYEIPFVENLAAVMQGNYDVVNGLSQVTTNIANRPSDVGGFTYQEDGSLNRSFEGYLEYKKEAGDLSMDFTLGYSYIHNQFNVDRNLRLLVDDASRDSLSIPDPLTYLDESQLQRNSAFISAPAETFDDREEKILGVFARGNFKYKDKYLLTATIRRDGSSKIRNPDERFGYFPALAAGWRVIDESFMDGASAVLSNLKLRLGWGISGSTANIGEFDNLPFFIRGDERAQYILGEDTLSTVRPTAVDADLTWETTQSVNLGIDFGFFEGRLTGSIDYYDKLTRDLIENVVFPIGLIPGDRAFTNVAEFESKGVDLLLNAIVIDKEDLRFDLTANASYNRNKILRLNRSNDPDDFGIELGGISGDVGRTIQVLRVGEANPSFLVYQHTRDANGNPLPDQEDHNGDGLINDLDIYVDQNGDGNINENDLVVNGTPAPEWIFGLTTNLTYKRWDFAMTFRGTAGNSMYNNIFSQYGNFEGVANSGFSNNIHRNAYQTQFFERQLLSDYYVQNASFVRLDNVTVGYSFSTSPTFRGRLYMTGTNLLTITSYEGLDPEAGGLSGIDNNPYPISRMFVLGVNLNF